MNLIQLTEDIFVDPDDVSSVQKEVIHKYDSPSISDNSMYCEFDGSIVTLKTGRKIAVRGMSPPEILDRLGKVIEIEPVVPKQIEGSANGL